jgi:chromosome segregation ATPase
MRKSSIHFEHNKDVKVGYFFHNDRSKPTQNSIFSTEKNYYNVSGKEATDLFFNELRKRELAYTKRTGRKLHKNTIRHISAIVNLDKHHTKNDVEKVVKYLEELLDTKIVQYSLHFDEGWVDENGNKNVNYHAHLELLGLDSQGKSVRKKLDRKTLIKIQDDIAKILGMERGINYTKERKKRPKRLDTYEYKEYAKRKHEEVKKLQKQLELKDLTNKQLLKEISELRKQLIEKNKQLEQKGQEKIYTAEDYKALSQLKKELKADNLQQVYQKFLELKLELKNKSKRNKELEEENERLKLKNKELEEKLLNIIEQAKALKEQIQQLKKDVEFFERFVTRKKIKIILREPYLSNSLNESETLTTENAVIKLTPNANEENYWEEITIEIDILINKNKDEKRQIKEALGDIITSLQARRIISSSEDITEAIQGNGLITEAQIEHILFEITEELDNRYKRLRNRNDWGPKI